MRTGGGVRAKSHPALRSNETNAGIREKQNMKRSEGARQLGVYQEERVKLKIRVGTRAPLC